MAEAPFSDDFSLDFGTADDEDEKTTYNGPYRRFSHYTRRPFELLEGVTLRARPTR